MLFDLTGHGVPLRILTYNMAATHPDAISGYAFWVDRPLEQKEHESESNYNYRVLTLERGIRQMDAQHDIDIIMLQEAPADCNLGTLFDFESYNLGNGQVLLYQKSETLQCEFDSEKHKIKEYPAIDQLTFHVGNPEEERVDIAFNSVRLGHQDIPRYHEEEIDALHKDQHQKTIITVGDFNCGVDL